MFGLALRSYQQKVQRLSESATDRGASLWEAVYEFVQEGGAVSRARVLTRFSRDDAASVRGILNDLVSSGLVYRTGRGDGTVYRVAPADDLAKALDRDDDAAETALLWLCIYREGPLARDALLERTRLAPEKLDAALAALQADSRVRYNETKASYSAETWLIPLGASAGWEAAFVDHYQTMVGAMCAKLAGASAQSGDGALIGGSTFSFDVWSGHPHAERALGLLERWRAEMSSLWNEVHAHNLAREKPAEYRRVSFYFGQNVQTESREE